MLIVASGAISEREHVDLRLRKFPFLHLHDVLWAESVRGDVHHPETVPLGAVDAQDREYVERLPALDVVDHGAVADLRDAQLVVAHRSTSIPSSPSAFSRRMSSSAIRTGIPLCACSKYVA